MWLLQYFGLKIEKQQNKKNLFPRVPPFLPLPDVVSMMSWPITKVNTNSGRGDDTTIRSLCLLSQ